MAKYTDAKCRQCRREGCKLFLKGERCTSGKCAIDRRPVVPGQHGAARKKATEYSLQLREKQKVKKANNDAVLIIYSKHKDLVFETFKYGAFFFIRKESFIQDMEYCQMRLNEYFLSSKNITTLFLLSVN